MRVARAALVDSHAAEVEFADGIHDEVDEMIRWHPLSKVRREQEWGVVVDIDEAGGHFLLTRQSQKPWEESLTGC